MEKYLVKAKIARACWNFKEAPADIEYFPKGEHIICCSVGGEPKEISVVVDENCAETMQKSLDAVFAAFDKGEASKPFLDFDHDGGRAAAYPRRFFWKDGLRLELEWTPAGRQAVECREYNYFSPEFFVDSQGRPQGVNFPGPIGGLCNVPAFQTIEKISATLTKGNDMPNSEEDEKKGQGGGNPPAKAQNEEGETLKKENEELKSKIAELEASAKAAEERAKNVEKEAASARRSAIETRVDALVAAGRAAAGSREAIVEAALKSGDNGEALFASYPERAAASGSPLPAGSQRGGEVGAGDGISLAAAGFKKQMSGE